jgi:hypothetical protein
MKQHGYKGYRSMEWEDAGDPNQGTAELIRQTVKYLSRDFEKCRLLSSWRRSASNYGHE